MLGLFKLLIPAALLSIASFSASSNYQLNNYGINSGGSNSSSSTTYKANVGAGEVLGGASGATTYTTKSGSIEAQQANVPGAPTLSNGSGTFYNKLHFTLSTSNNPTDAKFAVAVATDSGFTSIQYVQTDGSLSSSVVWQTYSQWGGSGGFDAIGLSSGTRYWFKSAAQTGLFTASAFGPSANEITSSGPTLSFSLTPNTVNMGALVSGSVISSGTVNFTFATNANFGGNVYVLGSSTGLASASRSHTIAVTPPSGNLSSLSEGFGLQGVSASAPLAIQSPYNGSANTVGAIYTTFQPLFSSTTAITGGTASALFKAKSGSTTPSASDYTVTLTFVAAASF